MPIGFVHLVGIPKQFQSRGYPIFDPTVLEFTSDWKNQFGFVFEQQIDQIRCALGLWFSHDANFWEPEIGLAWDLVRRFSTIFGPIVRLGLQSIFGFPSQVDSIKAGLPPPPLLRTQLEELTMFSEAEAR